MLFLLTLHSIVRWLVILVAVAAIVKLLIALFKRQDDDKMTSGLVSAFAGLMDTQLLLGLMFFIWNGLAGAGFPRQRWEHLVIMLVAVLVAHLPAMWKKAEPQKRLRNTLAAVLGSLVLVIVGVSLLQPNRWLVIFGL
jgi:heme A synthase